VNELIQAQDEHRLHRFIASANGHPTWACLARAKYSPTVLLEIRQARAIARFDKPISFLSRRISRIFRMDNRFWVISAASSFWMAGRITDEVDFPALFFPRQTVRHRPA
jgi:hypothetical protein